MIGTDQANYPAQILDRQIFRQPMWTFFDFQRHLRADGRFE